MNQTETKSKNKSKKRDKPGRILNSPNFVSKIVLGLTFSCEIPYS